MGKTNNPQSEHPSDYCILNGRADARLSDVERMTMLGGGGLDRLVQKLGKSLASVTLDAFAPGLDFSSLQAHHQRLIAARSSGALQRLFDPLSSSYQPAVVPIHGFPHGGVFDLEFRSTFPFDEMGIDPEYKDLVENQVSYVRLWEHEKLSPDLPTIIALHGWTMGDQRINSLAFLPGLFFSLGFNVAIVELPFHGRRKPASFDAGTPLFPSADPVRTCCAMAHAIHDLRILREFLRVRGHGDTACVGMSLGAYVGLLWCALDRLEKGVFMVPLVSMGDMAWELIRRQHRNDGELPRGMTKAFLRDLFLDHYPLGREPATDQGSILVIGGRGDHLVPKNQISLLRDTWSRVRIEWVSGGHGAPTHQGECLRAVRSFLGEKG